ncbi:hypothetical protein SAMN05428971_2842 [Candidatus Pantoea varia]|uniref:Uncharacterized protein n=1 Tax=Candidatus Pantoea varia TaxID=1881036 RepID=A0A1I5EAA9_9GAMM|nr:hypothetical protein SAMN05428971_2842 [Pantoea varia]
MVRFSLIADSGLLNVHFEREAGIAKFIVLISR